MNSLKKGALTLAGVVLGFSSFAATAQETTFIGYTTGCFSLACPPPTASGPQSITLGGATYNNSTFDVTTLFGGASIGSAPAVPNDDNLGSFTLLPTAFTYSGETFELRVTFSAPSGTTPGNTVLSTVLSGGVLLDGSGRLTIDFDNSPQHFIFDDGSFDLIVNDVDLTPGHSVPLTGRVLALVATVHQVPEPETYALFMAGLVALGFMARRRKT